MNRKTLTFGWITVEGAGDLAAPDPFCGHQGFDNPQGNFWETLIDSLCLTGRALVWCIPNQFGVHVEAYTLKPEDYVVRANGDVDMKAIGRNDTIVLSRRWLVDFHGQWLTGLRPWTSFYAMMDHFQVDKEKQARCMTRAMALAERLFSSKKTCADPVDPEPDPQATAVAVAAKNPFDPDAPKTPLPEVAKAKDSQEQRRGRAIDHG